MGPELHSKLLESFVCGHIAPPDSKGKVINNEFLSHGLSLQYPHDSSGQPIETWGRSLGKEHSVASKEKIAHQQ